MGGCVGVAVVGWSSGGCSSVELASFLLAGVVWSGEAVRLMAVVGDDGGWWLGSWSALVDASGWCGAVVSAVAEG